MSLHTAISQNIDSLDDLRVRLNRIQAIIDDSKVSDEVRSRLLEYKSDVSNSFRRYAYSLGNVIDHAYNN